MEALEIRLTALSSVEDREAISLSFRDQHSRPSRSDLPRTQAACRDIYSTRHRASASPLTPKAMAKRPFAAATAYSMNIPTATRATLNISKAPRRLSWPRPNPTLLEAKAHVPPVLLVHILALALAGGQCPSFRSPSFPYRTRLSGLTSSSGTLASRGNSLLMWFFPLPMLGAKAHI